MTLPVTIDDYLDRLLDALRLDGKASRRALAEVEDHLLTSTEAKMAEGVSQAEAEQAAIASFGYPEEVARRFNRTFLRDLRSSASRFLLAAMLVAGTVFIALGFSGALALAGGEIYGQDYIATPIPRSQLSEERCLHWLLARTTDIDECQSEELARDYRTVLEGRLTNFVFGILLVIAYFQIRRRWKGARYRPDRPSITFEAIGLAITAGLLYYVGFVDHPTHRFPGGQATGEMMTLLLVLGVCLGAYTALFTRKAVKRHRFSRGHR